MQLYGCECGGREETVVGSGVVLQSGTLAVWNAGRGQSRWELSAAVLETVSKLSVTLLPPPPPPSLTSLLSLSLVSRHKSVGPSCVTKMKQAQTTLFEPSMLAAASSSWGRRILKKCARASWGCETYTAVHRKRPSRLSMLCLTAAGTTRLT